MRFWSVNYKGHTIRVESRAFEFRLIVDGELQDAAIRTWQLTGVIRSGAGAGDPIKASLVGGFSVRCYIFVDHKLVQ